MANELTQVFAQRISGFTPGTDRFAAEFVDAALAFAREQRASDVHIVPGEAATAVHFRIDGVLHAVAQLPRGGKNVVTRLKVLAELLTYRTDVPQEGRIRERATGPAAPTDGDTNRAEIRVSTFPTLFGEKAVVRLFPASDRLQLVSDLKLPEPVEADLRQVLHARTGAVIVTGPAGSGKTTTLYACLREIQSAAEEPQSIATLEDPIERVVPGVAQSQVHPEQEFNYERGLKSLLRQDPDVIMVGEIRDRLVAETVFQAALSGHLVLTTFHAGRVVDGIQRLLDMGLPPYVVRSGLLAMFSQRLLRRLCACATDVPEAELPPGLPAARTPVGCDVCRQTGYDGRMVIAESVALSDSAEAAQLGETLIQQRDSASTERAARDAGLVTLRERAIAAVIAGETSVAEVCRVFGVKTLTAGGRMKDEGGQATIHGSP